MSVPRSPDTYRDVIDALRDHVGLGPTIDAAHYHREQQAELADAGYMQDAITFAVIADELERSCMRRMAEATIATSPPEAL